jgi:diguanylate cyclase (GGDEF)-like protein
LRSPDPETSLAPDRRRVARSLGVFYVAAPVAAELWLLFERPAPSDAPSLLVMCIVAQILGILLLRGFADMAPRRALKLLLSLATLLVAGLCVFSGATDNGFAYLYLWVTPYAFFFGLRHAVGQGTLAVLTLLTTHLVLDSNPLDSAHAGDWLLPVGTLVVVGGMVHRLTSELGRVDRERLRIERERAELEAGRAASARDRAQREAAMSRLGRVALRVGDADTLVREALAVLADTLHVEHAEVLELADGGARVRLAAGTGHPADVADQEDLPVEDRLLTGWVLAGDKPAVVWEWATERRFEAVGLRARGIRSTAAAGIRGRNGAFGIIAVHAETIGAFSAEDGQWLQSFADLLAAALDRDHSEAVVRHQSLHDALTGLPNRALLSDRLEHGFARAERDGVHVAVLLLDVDQFKTINDSLGHEAGDDLLVALSARLQHVTRGSDTVARLGGDEFVVLCEVESEDEAFAIAGRIADAWELPIPLGSGGEIFVSASIGIAVARGHRSAEQMLREADAAMYRAKEGGRGRFELFDEEMRRDAFERLRTESELRRALERDQFRLVYQPIVDVADCRLIGFEALVRWERPGYGALVSPADFIPIAEETGLIAPLGRWVLEQATADLAAWRLRNPAAADVRLTVNVSGRQLGRPEFLDEVRNALRRSGLRPESLGLEITESVLFKDASSLRSTLEALRRMGVRVLLDDFGTGYSSLSRLKGFPVDAIKVDRSFIDGLGSEEEDTAIVGAVVEIARSLGLEAIAEGVEHPDQLVRLRELGCTAAQGYLLAPPRPVTELDAALALGAHAPIEAWRGGVRVQAEVRVGG